MALTYYKKIEKADKNVWIKEEKNDNNGLKAKDENVIESLL